MSPSAEPSCSKHSELTGVGEWQSWGCRDIATGRWMAARRRAARPRDHPVAAPPHAAASFLGFTFFFFSFSFSSFSSFSFFFFLFSLFLFLYIYYKYIYNKYIYIPALRGLILIYSQFTCCGIQSQGWSWLLFRENTFCL